MSNLTDHLGNVRVTFTDDGNGNAEIIQEDHYYPFGMRMNGMHITTENLFNKFLYNGKELQDQTNYYDYGFRQMDPQLGRWHVADAMAEAYLSTSPYAYVKNDPVNHYDVMGLWMGGGAIGQRGRVLYQHPDGRGGRDDDDFIYRDNGWSRIFGMNYRAPKILNPYSYNEHSGQTVNHKGQTVSYEEAAYYFAGRNELYMSGSDAEGSLLSHMNYSLYNSETKEYIEGKNNAAYMYFPQIKAGFNWVGDDSEIDIGSFTSITSFLGFGPDFERLINIESFGKLKANDLSINKLGKFARGIGWVGEGISIVTNAHNFVYDRNAGNWGKLQVSIGTAALNLIPVVGTGLSFSVSFLDNVGAFDPFYEHLSNSKTWIIPVPGFVPVYYKEEWGWFD